MPAKIEIIQTTSPNGNVYLIHKFMDGNTHPSFDIYKLVDNETEVAKEFGISNTIPGRKSPLNAREMCKKMVDKIQDEKLHYKLE